MIVLGIDPGPSETQIQRTFVEWLQWNRAPGLVWYAIPNEGLRNARTGARLKAQGMRAGTPDMAFVLPGGRAAFIEFKTPKGRLSADQRHFALTCERLGIPHRVCRSSDEAIAALSSWISGARVAEAKRATE
jgi:hypothetical protein